MKPGGSPRFESAALRSSIAAMSACGFRGTTFGAEQASDSAAPTPAVQYTRRFMASPVRSRDAKRTAGAPRGDGRAIQEALPRTDAEGSLAATLLCRLFPLRLAALRPGLGPLLARLLFGLGSRRLLPFLRGLRPGRRHRLIPHRRGGRPHRGGPRVQPVPPPPAGARTPSHIST